jgi:D-tyrosyl-tRNA(Tyr) deacylase
MKVVIQRVTNASVLIDFEETRSINKGLVILLGIGNDDNDEDINWLCQKICNLRIFDDQEGVMNLSVKDISGDVLLISQFTLLASTKKGNRPSYINAAPPEVAIPLYEKFIIELSSVLEKNTVTGKFGSNMQVSLTNNGPVTIIIDTKDKV